MSFIGKAIGSITGSNKAADAATQGAQISADAQREGLAYLKETEAIPQELRQGALKGLGALFGLGGDGDAALSALKGSAAYKNILGTRAAGEDAILRNASVTCGLRSGNTNDALARYNSELEMAAFDRGLGGLSGLAQLPSNANNIAALTGNIGNTLAQGQIAAGSATQAGRGLALSSAIGLAGGLAGSGVFGGGGGGLGSLGSGISPGISAGGGVYGGTALGSGIAFSDARLKSNVKHVGERNGLPWYTWEWSDEAAELGLFGNDEGHMAHEVMQARPDAIRVSGDYLTVDYKELEH